MIPRRTRVMLLAAVLVGTAGLTGCTDQNHDLPSLTQPAPSASTDLVAIAKTFYDCMTDAGITVVLSKNFQGEPAVVSIADSDASIWCDGKGSCLSNNPQQDPAFDQESQDFARSHEQKGDPPGLLIDGVDYSAPYAQCLSQSGYSYEDSWGQMQTDPVYLQLQVASNNKWAACARDNGWPDTQDSAIPADDLTVPEVLLPATIAEDQLRQLLVACPDFDPQQEDNLKAWQQSNPGTMGYPDDYVPDPYIGFDTSVLTLNGQNGISEIDADKLNRLTAILDEQRQEYDQQHGG